MKKILTTPVCMMLSILLLITACSITPGNNQIEELSSPVDELDALASLPEDFPIIEQNNDDFFIPQDDFLSRPKTCPSCTKVTYSVSLTLEEAASYYEKKMPESGWTLTGSTVLKKDEAILLNFSNAELLCNVNVSDDGKTVWVQIEILQR